MSWFDRKKPFLPPPPEGYRWYAEEGSSYKFRLKLIEPENGYPVAIYTEYADHEWGLPWAARRILKQYRKDQDRTKDAVVRRVNETDWSEQ